MRAFIDKLILEWGNIGDGMSVSLFMGTLLDMLPTVAALLSILWFSLRIWESETIQSLLMRRRIDKHNEDNLIDRN
jgi:hypothetical protein